MESVKRPTRSERLRGRKGRKEQIFFSLWKAADEKCVYAAVGQVGRAQRHGCGPRGSATRWCTNKQWLRAPEPNWTQQARVGRCNGTKVRNSKCSHMDGRQNLIGEPRMLLPEYIRSFITSNHKKYKVSNYRCLPLLVDCAITLRK